MPAKKKATENENNAKVFDVAKPGETAANPTARPIIVGHGKQIERDPMVVEDPETIETEEPKIRPIGKSKRVIKPIDEQEVSQDLDEVNTSDSDVETPKTEEPKPEEPDAAEQPETDNTKEDSSTDEVDSNEDSVGGAVDALAEEITTKREAEKALEEEIKRTEEIERLIASKKYFVHTKTPAGTRRTLWSIVIFLLIAAAAAAYLLMGPGRSLWAKTDTPLVLSEPVSTQTQSKTPKTTYPAADENHAVFNDQNYGLYFQYPKTWKAEVGKDAARTGADLITLSAPAQKMMLAREKDTVPVEAFMRLHIGVEQTTDTKKYPTRQSALQLCKTENIIISGNSYKLALVSVSSKNPSALVVASEDCSKALPYTINDQLQLPTKKNTYTITAEYVLSDGYLKNTGITDPNGVRLAQQQGIQVTEAGFKASTSYPELRTLIQSLRALQ